jgi:heat shock protein HslJ
MTATLMACEDAVMQQADQYRAALAAVRTYAVVSATLTLRSETEDLLTYEAQAQDLAGTSWSALSYNNGNQAVVSVAAGTQITATFGFDGTLTGFSGCNRYAGPYEAAEGAIGIGPLSSTRMACPEPAMSQEAQYLAALATAATYAIEAGKLELRTADGALAASYLESASE